MIQYIEPELILPEQTIIPMGSEGHKLWFVAEGSCQIEVLTNMRGKKSICKDTLEQDSYFGEVSLIYDILTTATI